jgi:hypothetical protein
MKKIIWLGFLFLLIVGPMLAQDVTLKPEDMKKLPPEVQQQINAINTQNKVTENLEAVGKWAGMGKEIGTAVNESLKAVSSTVVDLSETRVGKITMALVIYKVIGGDVIQFFVGLLWLAIILIVSWKMYRNNCERMVLTSKKWNSEGKGWDKQYQRLSEDPDYKTAAIVIFCIGIAASLLIFLV